MTDEEWQAAIRAKVLVARLRRRDPYPSWEYMYDDAAGELERLANEIERLAKERDAWRKIAEDKDKEIVIALGGREPPSRR